MDYTIFLKKIQNKMVQGPYAFVGEEIYLADNTLRVLKENYVEESLETMNYMMIDASKSSVNDIMESCYQLPLMAEKRLTVVKDISENQIKEIGHKMDDLIKIGSTSIIIFLICPFDLKKNTKFYKTLSKIDAIVNFDTVSEANVKNWINRKIRSKKIEINDDAFEMFLMHINYRRDNENNSLYFVDGELNKLFNLNKKTIEINDVESITSKSPSSNIFKMTDAISDRDEKMAIIQLNRLFDTNEEPVKILYMISRHITNMAKVYQVQRLSDYEAMKRIGISSFEYKKIKSKINKYNFLELKNGVKLVKEADIIIKTKKNDPKILLESLLFRFMRFIDVDKIGNLNWPR